MSVFTTDPHKVCKTCFFFLEAQQEPVEKGKCELCRNETQVMTVPLQGYEIRENRIDNRIISLTHRKIS